jgi:hypothetical protein
MCILCNIVRVNLFYCRLFRTKVESNDHYNLILYIFHATCILKFITNQFHFSRDRLLLFHVQGPVHHEYMSVIIQQYAPIHSLFMSVNCCTCFRWYLHSSSGANVTVSTPSGICKTVLQPVVNVTGRELYIVASCWIIIDIYVTTVTYFSHL